METWSKDLGAAIEALDTSTNRGAEGYVEGRTLDDLKLVVAALRHVKRGLDDVAREAEQAKAMAETDPPA